MYRLIFKIIEKCFRCESKVLVALRKLQTKCINIYLSALEAYSLDLDLHRV